MGSSAVLFFLVAVGGLILGIFGIGGISFEMGRILLFAFLLMSFLAFSWDLLFERLPRRPPPRWAKYERP